MLEVDLHGKLSRSDYEWFVPETERLILKHGKIRILVTMHDFEGWDATALWEDIINSTAHVDEEVHENVLEIRLHGKLNRSDYEQFVPESEKLMLKYGRIRLLMIMDAFHGWDAGALWDAVKWNSRHFSQIERLAVVGEKPIEVRNTSGAFDLGVSREVHWQKWMTNFSRPFTNAEVRYFAHDELDTARAWINGI